MFIIGSVALGNNYLNQYYLSPVRQPADLDIICTHAEMHDFAVRHDLQPVHRSGPYWIVNDAPTYKHIEFLLSDDSLGATAYTGYVDAWLKDMDYRIRYHIVYGECIPLAPVEVLYSLKRSHRFLPRAWEKHISDYHFLRMLMNGVDKMPEVTKIKQAETKLKTPSLDKSKADFFKDNVSNHVFEHDQIHEVMAHRELPMFEYIKIDPNKVACSKEKFYALTQEQRIQCVLEEAYVIALERAIIPMLYEGKKFADADKALEWAIMRICTTLCSGWFRDFAVDNYYEILNSANPAYPTVFTQAVDLKRIKRLDKKPSTILV
jgi:hypothetical protein